MKIPRLLITPFITLVMCSFIIDKEHNAPRLGDQVEFFKASGSVVTDSIHGKIWDFSNYEVCDIANTLQIDSFPDRPNQWVTIIDGCRHYINIHDNGISFEGFEKPGSSIKNIQSPYLDYSKPSSEGNYNGTGMIYEEINLEFQGKYNFKTLTGGTIITPDGDTIPETTKIDYTTVATIHYFPKHLDKDSHSGAEGENMERLSFWYAPGYRYPIFTEHSFTSDNGRPEIRTFYIPLCAQEQIFDPENKNLRDSINTYINPSKNIADNITKTGNPDYNPDTKPYSFSQNSSESYLNIDFDNNFQGDAEFILADVNGIVFKVEKKHIDSENQLVTISYNALPSGRSYLLHVTLPSGHFSEVFNR